MLEVFKGRPTDIGQRLEREVRVYDLLDTLGVWYERVDHEPAMTMEVCAQIDEAFGRVRGAEAASIEDRESHPVICKNLFLCNRQKTRYYLLMMPGDKKFLTKDLSAQINSARLSFAGDEDMLAFLDVTPGSVSVMGLMNDKENRVQLLIDSDVLRSDYVGCHPCMNTSSLRLKVSDLMDRILPAIHHDPITVVL
ncbi:MAG: prolyl-tRNA synthetase associated domain-containing protein [Bacteroidales bacterium]|nr:prolyl-tRNA synthetase associated domain-containing protein [Bacteroidales bacterium]